MLGQPMVNLVFKLDQPCIDCVTFKKISLQNLCGPNAELGCHDRINTITNGDYHIQIVKLLFAYNHPATLILNSFHFGNSCLTAKLSRGIDILQMLAYGRLLHAKQFRNLQLGQPNAFMCIPCLQPDGLVRLVHDYLVFT